MEPAPKQAGYGFPLSVEQEELWLRAERDGHQPFRSQCVVWLDGPVVPERLDDAVRSVVARHEILRTSFRRVPGLKLPVQIVSEDAAFEWNARRLTGAPLPEDAAADATLREDAVRPFDVDGGPCLRATLLTFSERHHVLVLTLTALCGDIASLTNLWREAAAVHGGDAGQAESLEEPIQYADYAAWQRERTTSSESGGAAPRAASGGPAANLPLQQRPRETSGFDPDALRVPLTDDVVAALQGLAAQEGVPAARVLKACWAALFWRLAGDEVLLEVAADGRDAEELRDAIGLFERVELQTLAFDRRTSLRQALQRIPSRVGDAGARLPERDGSALGYREETASPPVFAGGVKFAPGRSFGWTRPFGLALAVRGSRESLGAELHYDRGRFDAAAAERLAGHFVTFLRAALAAPDDPLAALPLLTPAERDAIVIGFNPSPAARLDAACVHHLFEDQSHRTPDAVAVVSGEQQWTYRRLNARANQLAALLRRAGARRDTGIGLCVDRSAETVVGLLGILKAGSAYVPMNADHPDSRLLRQLASSRASLLVTTEAIASRFAGFEGRIVRLDADAPLIDREPTADPERLSDPEDLVSIIHTSGSTGEPKGVATPHRALAHYARAFLGALGPPGGGLEGAPLSFATVSTIAADLGNTAIFPALLSGGTLHVVPYDVATDAAQLAAYFDVHGVDLLKIVPSHFRALIADAPPGKLLPRRFLVFGGEALSLDLADRAQREGRCTVVNHYGPTESTVGSLMTPAAQAPRDRIVPTVPIGRPIGDTDVYILEESGLPAPPGVAGELYIGGAGVARGYFDLPVETALRFVPHPFSSEPGRRLYRTGDRARFLPDGTVVFLGRVDDQAKIRGYRVEPGEIAELLRVHPAVQEALVVTRDGPAGTVLAAYLVGADPAGAGRPDLRGYLRERLPDYMIPSSFTWLEAIPLSSTGKVDRGALPQPDAEVPDDCPLEAPRTAAERALAEVWAAVLHNPRLGIHDDFFELGGHSLLATQVVARARTALGVHVTLRDLFDNPTIAGLAAAVSGRPPTGAPVRAPGGPLPAGSEASDRVDRLSDEEVDRLLGEILARDEAQR